ncbi:MAG: hypothetical protein FWG55_01220 [Candidatus Bathyarchaeota archaeon]|nr:hypothetical protein [Candidatus Termiticorpusculum sp.]
MNNTIFCYKRAVKLPLLSIACTLLLAIVGKLIFGVYYTQKRVDHLQALPQTDQTKQIQGD